MGAGTAATQTMPHAGSKYNTIHHTIAWNPTEIKLFVMTNDGFLNVLNQIYQNRRRSVATATLRTVISLQQ